MAIFAVIGSDEPEKLEKRIHEEFPEQYYMIGEGQWFVSGQLTTKEVYDKITQEGTPQEDLFRFIIIPVPNYWGWHSNDTWEWLHVRRETQKA